ncbi:MAG: hypothetical protein K2Y21_06290 [Phycisphaerales bacterium]|nr:hypothetical protein [Phycisphaerales bacterium]
MRVSTLSAAALVAASCGVTHAAIVNALLQATQISQPADAQLNVLTSPSTAYAWNEVQNYTLSSALRVNASASGTYNSAASLSNSFISAGTTISSHYIHFDSPGSTSGAIQGRVRFDQKILGVIVVNTPGQRDLDDSDYLGAPTLFTPNVDARGLELVNDSFTISASGLVLDFSLTISTPGDYIRVITVPAPSSAALAGLALAALARRRRA